MGIPVGPEVNTRAFCPYRTGTPSVLVYRLDTSTQNDWCLSGGGIWASLKLTAHLSSKHGLGEALR